MKLGCVLILCGQLLVGTASLICSSCISQVTFGQIKKNHIPYQKERGVVVIVKVVPFYRYISDCFYHKIIDIDLYVNHAYLF